MKKTLIINIVGLVFVFLITFFKCGVIDTKAATYFWHLPWGQHSFSSYLLYDYEKHQPFVHQLREGGPNGRRVYAYCYNAGPFVPQSTAESNSNYYRRIDCEKCDRKLRGILLNSYPFISISKFDVEGFKDFCNRKSNDDCKWSRVKSYVNNKDVLVSATQRAVWRVRENKWFTIVGGSSNGREAVREISRYLYFKNEVKASVFNAERLRFKDKKPQSVEWNDKGQLVIKYRLVNQNGEKPEFISKIEVNKKNTTLTRIINGKTTTIKKANYNITKNGYNVTITIKKEAASKFDCSKKDVKLRVEMSFDYKRAKLYKYVSNKQSAIGAEKIDRNVILKNTISDDICKEISCEIEEQKDLKCVDEEYADACYTNEINFGQSYYSEAIPKISNEGLKTLFETKDELLDSDTSKECKNKYCNENGCCRIDVKFDDFILDFSLKDETTSVSNYVFKDDVFANLIVTKTCYPNSNECSNTDDLEKHIPDIIVDINGNKNITLQKTKKGSTKTNEDGYCIYTEKYEYRFDEKSLAFSLAKTEDCGKIGVKICPDDQSRCVEMEDRVKCPINSKKCEDYENHCEDGTDVEDFKAKYPNATIQSTGRIEDGICYYTCTVKDNSEVSKTDTNVGDLEYFSKVVNVVNMMPNQRKTTTNLSYYCNKNYKNSNCGEDVFDTSSPFSYLITSSSAAEISKNNRTGTISEWSEVRGSIDSINEQNESEVLDVESSVSKESINNHYIRFD